VVYDRYPGFALVVSPKHSSEINSIKDLANKKVGVSAPGSSTDVTFDASEIPTCRTPVARAWATHLTGPIARLEKRILRPLASLGPPSEVATPYRELLQRFAIDAEAREAQARALEAGSFNIFTQVQEEFFTDNAPAQEALLREVGLGSCLQSDPTAGAA